MTPISTGGGGASSASVTSAIATHEADTTNVHGITDTSLLTTGATAAAITQRLSAGVESVSELVATTTSITMGSGTLRLARFTSPITVTCTTLAAYQGATALVPGTGITIKVGAYTIDGNGDMTLVARTANQTGFFQSSTGAENTGAMDTTGGYPASYQFVQGTFYALALVLVMTGGTTPTLKGHVRTGTNGAGRLIRNPLLGASLSAQTDLPTSITKASLTETTQVIYLAAV